MSWLGEIRSSVRTLAKNPAFTAVAVTMLALGIGVNGTVFTVTNGVLFKGFPHVKRNDRLLYISDGGCCISYPDFEDIRAQSKSFQGVGIVHGIGMVLNDSTGFAERLEVTEVSADTFRTVGQKPMMGRDFRPSDEKVGAPAVAMLSYGFWERRYAKDPAIVGRTIRMNGAATTLIGVMPEGFSFPQKVDVWVPLVRTAKVESRKNADTWCAFGRLADGVTFESARIEVEGIIKRLEIEDPPTDWRRHLVVQNFTQFFIGSNAGLIYGSMWAAVGFVLLIACANLANLMLARAIGRSREISVRIALGAGRWRIMRQLLIESVMLSAAGGLFGWWIAKWGVRSYALAMSQKSSWLIVDYAMDQRVVWYLIAISVGTGLVFGLMPALRLSKLDINVALKDGGRGATGGARAKRLSTLLVSGEMALAIVLLAGAGVMVRSFLKIHSAEIGVDTDKLLVGEVSLTSPRYPNADARIAFVDRLKSRVEAMPGVESMALGGSLPTWATPKSAYETPGSKGSGQNLRDQPKLAVLTISPNYFQTVGARVLSGRSFDEHDGPSAAPIAVVNERLASKFWPGETALGKRIRLFDGNTPGPLVTIVGVVSNIIQNDQTRQKFDPVMYLTYRQNPTEAPWILVRTRVPPQTLATAFRREIQNLDPDLPVYGSFSLRDRLERFWDSRFYGTLFLIFATISLLLASVGLYTVIAHSVSQRTQEIGVRMAIGATTHDIRKLVLIEGAMPLGIGLAIGLLASLALNRVLAAELVQVSPGDPITLVAASVTLVFAAMLGCLIPARRAMRVDPVVALRHE